jgi:hypothetical protein
MAYNMPAHIAGDIANVHIQGRAIKSRPDNFRKGKEYDPQIYEYVAKHRGESKTPKRPIYDAIEQFVGELKGDELTKEFNRVKTMIVTRDKKK